MDYKRGYLIGYLEALQAFKGRLVFDEDEPYIYLTDIANWLEATERAKREELHKSVKETPHEQQ